MSLPQCLQLSLLVSVVFAIELAGQSQVQGCIWHNYIIFTTLSYFFLQPLRQLFTIQLRLLPQQHGIKLKHCKHYEGRSATALE